MKSLEIRLIAGGALFAFGLILHYMMDADTLVQLAVFGTSYLIVGYNVVYSAGRNIVKGNVLDENFLMTIATLGAFAISMYPEAVAVMLFFQVGEWFEKRAVGKTRRSIADLMDIQPDYAHVIRDGKTETVGPDEVRVGETIEVLPGEKVPLDGTIVSG